jgi:peptide/nickel transport system permease protein
VSTFRSWFGALPNRLRAGLVLLAGLATLALVGPTLGADPIEILDPRGLALLPPAAQRFTVTLKDGSTLAAETVDPGPQTVEITRLGRTESLPADSVAAVATRRFWLGTDTVGRDLLARLLAGARVSLLVGGLALLTTLIVGVGVGLLAGWWGGMVDAVLMRAVDALLAIPMLFLMILLAALFRPSLPVLAAILGLSSWMGVARLARAQVLSLKERDYVLGARALGAGPWRIVLFHLLPNALTPLTQDAALRLGDLILAEAALSYLGLGVQPPVPSWGAMVAEGQGVISGSWWLMLLPSAFITLTVIAAALVADGLQVATRPGHVRA